MPSFGRIKAVAFWVNQPSPRRRSLHHCLEYYKDKTYAAEQHQSIYRHKNFSTQSYLSGAVDIQRSCF